jgi:hypothetical protein
MFRLNEMSSNLAVYSSESCANFVRCLMTSGFSKTSFSTAKNLNCLNLENESSPTFENRVALLMTQRVQLRHSITNGETVILEAV